MIGGTISFFKKMSCWLRLSCSSRSLAQLKLRASPLSKAPISVLSIGGLVKDIVCRPKEEVWGFCCYVTMLKKYSYKLPYPLTLTKFIFPRVAYCSWEHRCQGMFALLGICLILHCAFSFSCFLAGDNFKKKHLHPFFVIKSADMLAIVSEVSREMLLRFYKHNHSCM
jgi:hypothetical protein